MKHKAVDLPHKGVDMKHKAKLPEEPLDYLNRTDSALNPEAANSPDWRKPLLLNAELPESRPRVLKSAFWYDMVIHKQRVF
ncbi:MAG: hypothetical protein LBD08_01950 [Treponema sp.]|nr:hypothetical protein [Treponema sp.]